MRDEWEDQRADYDAEMRAQGYDAPRHRSERKAYREYRSEERFTAYDQHGFLDSEWQR